MRAADPQGDCLRVLRHLACSRPDCTCHRAARLGRGMTHCPAHTDHNPSLSVRPGASAPLWTCFGGCSREAVRRALEALGLLRRRP